MTAFLLDTNVISEFAKRNREERVLRWMSEQSPTDLYLSAVTLGEVTRGIVRMPEGRRRDALNRWMYEELFVEFEGQILPFDQPTAIIWGEILGQGDRRGRPLAIVDAQLAATALRHGLVVATRNITDFQAAGVAVVNPWDAA